MFKKKTNSYTEFLGKTNRIVEGTTIKGDVISQADFRLDGELIGNFQTKGKIVIAISLHVLWYKTSNCLLSFNSINEMNFGNIADVIGFAIIIGNKAKVPAKV